MVATIENAMQACSSQPRGSDSACEPTTPPAALLPGIQMLFRLPFRRLGDARAACIRLQKELFVQAQYFGGVLASTHRWKCRRHVEDGSLASLKTGPNQINADNEGLALAA